ncbi:protein BatD [Oleiharenicola lentus]|uniref:Protein BatD n=1 Tax=Oleiharenicola lentus TaxID=2508720 RepID=A0A4Q1C4G2_9BACT|nr:BatD family protein [Oleiharenicola lentus]RXK53304.1 protein BatD [Oleiharenicola lentus]
MRRNPPTFSFFAGACLQALIRFIAGKPAPAWGLVFFATALPALAQSIRWDPPGGQLGFNQVSQLSLVFEDCEPDNDPKLPTVDGLQFGTPGQSSQTSIINFKMTRTFALVFPVRPTKRAAIIIPPFEVQTDKGTLKVAAARYTVGDAPVGNSGLTINDVASASLEIPKKSVWAGEVFPVAYNLDVIRRYFHSLGSSVAWESAPAIADDWTKPEPSEALIRGERHVIAAQTTRASIKQPGIYTLKPAGQLINLMVGSSGFGLFTQPNVEQRQLESNSLELTVKALPAAPPEFTGAVGQFTFVSKVVPLTAAVGEPVTWTLELAGTGNWPDLTGLPQREVSNDFQVVQPKSKRTMKDGTLFEGTLTEDVVLVPTKPGTYRLPPVRFSYFDSDSGTYKTVASEPATVTITAGSAPVVPPASSGAPVQFSLAPPTPAPATPALPTAVAPVPPENLPREQLEQSARGHAPVELSKLVRLCLLSAVLGPLLLWLTLAALRSRERDPQRTRREARAALRLALAELRNSGAQPSAFSAPLRRWQQHTATLWQIPHAAPGARLVHASIQRHSLNATAWTKLWEEADRALHGRDAALPQDWLNRAEGALQAVKIPGWNPFSLFAGRNLLPFLSGLFILSALLAPSESRADTASEAYRRGDFAAATTAWQQSVKTTPTDWAARHNLGLALAQQDRWAEAAAHWTGAFLLNARADVTRYDLNLGIQRSGLANPQLVELSRGEGRYQIARLASPGEWQLALVLAALLLAAALVLLLLQGYRRIGGWGKPTALSATLLAIILAGAATFSLHVYGQLAHPDAVFVWRATTLRSIPTEADTTQKTSPLSAGSVAVVEKTFLGWTKLTFPGGQSGWVRNEELIGLYR